MSRTHHHGRYRIEGEWREKADGRRIGRALQRWHEAQKEAEAAAAHDAPAPLPPPKRKPTQKRPGGSP